MTAQAPIFRWSATPTRPPEHHAVADAHTSREANLPTEQAVCADLNIVANHHEVVDLGPSVDSGRLQGAAVNGGQCPDLDIIGNLNGRQRVNLLQLVAFRIVRRRFGALGGLERAGPSRYEAEPVRTNRRVVMQNDAVSYTASPTNPNAGINDTIRAEGWASGKCRLRQYHRTGPDRGSRADHHQGPDGRTFSDHRIGCDHGTLMYARIDIRTTSENVRDLWKTGASHADED
jgi:hypothetical protein